MAQCGVEMTFDNHEAVVPDVAVTTTSVSVQQSLVGQRTKFMPGPVWQFHEAEHCTGHRLLSRNWGQLEGVLRAAQFVRLGRLFLSLFTHWAASKCDSTRISLDFEVT